MQGLQTRHTENDQAAADQSQDHLSPYVFWDSAEFEKNPLFPLPTLGEHLAPGWKRLQNAAQVDEVYQVQTLPDVEPKGHELTLEEAKELMKDVLETHQDSEIGWGIIHAPKPGVLHIAAYEKIQPPRSGGSLQQS